MCTLSKKDWHESQNQAIPWDVTCVHRADDNNETQVWSGASRPARDIDDGRPVPVLPGAQVIHDYLVAPHAIAKRHSRPAHATHCKRQRRCRLPPVPLTCACCKAVYCGTAYSAALELSPVSCCSHMKETRNDAVLSKGEKRRCYVSLK